jgi:hypothetical protein
MIQGQKSQSLNPYEIKVAVSTGPRGPGRRRFVTGTVEQLRRRWRSQGVNVVRREHANYVVVPDGVENPGRIHAQPIFYSEFVNLLQTHTPPIRKSQKSRALEKVASPSLSPSPLNREHSPSVDSSSFNFARHHRFLEQTLENKRGQRHQPAPRQEIRQKSKMRLDAGLDAGLEAGLEPGPKTGPRPRSPPLADPVHEALQAVKSTWGRFVADDASPPQWYATEERYDAVEDIMKQLTQPSWQKAVERAVDVRAPFHVELYNETMQLLDRMAHATHRLLRYWSALRVNTEVQLDLSPRVKLSETEPCELPASTLSAIQAYLPGRSPILSAWEHYRNHWNAETQQTLGKPDLWQNVPQQQYPGLAQYFWQIETDLYLMYDSLRCALKTWRSKFRHWARDVRARPQQPWPFLFVMSDLVKAYCGSSGLPPSTPADQRGLLWLWDELRSRHESWFGQSASGSREQNISEACADIRRLHHDLEVTLKRDLGLSPGKDLVWSQLARLADVQGVTWEHLWSRDAQVRAPILDYLKQMIYSEQYQRAARQALLPRST